jgi:tRNA-2-methylthio-N6-dimethylallyladenosine synthase
MGTELTAQTTGRTYRVRTYGCQMNVHDSERLAGLLEDAGYLPAPEGDQADVVVFNTCAVRENADNRLYGNLGHLKPVKDRTPGMQIAVGGCLAQKDQGLITTKAPWVDVVFGTHNVGALPEVFDPAAVLAGGPVVDAAPDAGPSTLPATSGSAGLALLALVLIGAGFGGRRLLRR